ncbi:MAG: sulfotransferase [Nitrospinales bacterium]
MKIAEIKKRIPVKYKHIGKRFYVGLRVLRKQKIFCIGANKTGTTSMKAALEELGIIVAPQRPAEELVDDWAKRDFNKLIRFCKYSGQAFQDIPFSYPFTYVVLDYSFPSSKFILTIRDSSEQWYSSLTKFHAKMWGDSFNVPNKKDLQNAYYVEKGFPWKVNRYLYTTPEKNPYEKKKLIEHYEQHNRSILNYFRHRENDLLVINVKSEGAYHKLAKFLKIETDNTKFPWLNKT